MPAPDHASDHAPVPLRRAVAADAPAMSDLAFRTKRSNGHDDAFMAACRDELAVTVEDLATDEYWVAGAEDVRGFAALRCGTTSDVGEVHAFFVDPARQRLGIGRRLWEGLVGRARSRGLDAPDDASTPSRRTPPQRSERPSCRVPDGYPSRIFATTAAP